MKYIALAWGQYFQNLWYTPFPRILVGIFILIVLFPIMFPLAVWCVWFEFHDWPTSDKEFWGRWAK